jgi:hypothetical protein
MASGAQPLWDPAGEIVFSSVKYEKLGECFPSSGGSVRVSLLPYSLNILSDGNRPMLTGISPEKLLRERNKYVRFCKCPKTSGMVPVRLLSEKSIMIKLIAAKS